MQLRSGSTTESYRTASSRPKRTTGGGARTRSGARPPASSSQLGGGVQKPVTCSRRDAVQAQEIVELKRKVQVLETKMAVLTALREANEKHVGEIIKSERNHQGRRINALEKNIRKQGQTLAKLKATNKELQETNIDLKKAMGKATSGGRWASIKACISSLLVGGLLASSVALPLLVTRGNFKSNMRNYNSKFQPFEHPKAVEYRHPGNGGNVVTGTASNYGRVGNYSMLYEQPRETKGGRLLETMWSWMTTPTANTTKKTNRQDVPLTKNKSNVSIQTKNSNRQDVPLTKNKLNTGIPTKNSNRQNVSLTPGRLVRLRQLLRQNKRKADSNRFGHYIDPGHA